MQQTATPMNRFSKAKEFNQRVRYIQGFRNTINASSSTTFTVTLNSVGKFLLGITVMPVSALLTTLGDTQVTLVVNNNNVLLATAANNMNPNFVGNMLYFPTPQPLFGNDSISITFIKNDAASPVVLYNFFYLPQIKK
jgi:hypothetical protein